MYLFLRTANRSTLKPAMTRLVANGNQWNDQITDDSTVRRKIMTRSVWMYNIPCIYCWKEQWTLKKSKGYIWLRVRSGLVNQRETFGPPMATVGAIKNWGLVSLGLALVRRFSLVPLWFHRPDVCFRRHYRFILAEGSLCKIELVSNIKKWLILNLEKWRWHSFSNSSCSFCVLQSKTWSRNF